LNRYCMRRGNSEPQHKSYLPVCKAIYISGTELMVAVQNENGHLMQLVQECEYSKI
jgi:hypothetical protein